MPLSSSITTKNERRFYIKELQSMFNSKKVILALTLIMLSGATSQARAEVSPCEPIRAACLTAGFQLKNQANGNRLIGDCMMLLVQGKDAAHKANWTRG